MDHESAPAYGLWGLVVVNSAVFTLFAVSFFRPASRRDWRTLGAFSGFVVALFAEMYGFPLTIYLLSGWLAERMPGQDLLSHDSGHLWYSLLGARGNPHGSPIHVLSNVIVLAGFLLLAAAWRVLWAAQQSGQLATTGAYAHVRHPQYAAFLMIMTGFLLMWPTLPTLILFPILATMYVRLARREEAEAAGRFGESWSAYADRTPGWIPIARRPAATGGAPS